MKKTRLFLFALAFAAALVGCTPEQQPGDEEENVVKSTECKLTAFVVKVEGEVVEAFIDQVDKTIELSYLPLQYKGLQSATAEVVISEKATISPDPSAPQDYTSEGGVDFTVTAEDGVTKTVYTVYAEAAEIEQAAVMKWDKTYGQLGLTAKSNNDCGVGFVALDKVAFADLKVIDLNGSPVGTLNTEGITGLCTYGDGAIKSRNQLAALSNDENGVLVALACYEGPHDPGATGDCYTEVYAWLDGWDKAPTKVYGPVDYQCSYMSVAGDVKGDFILNFRTGANTPQMHHVLVYQGANGQFFKADGSANCTWSGPFIQHPGTDGCWGQQLSFFSGNPEDGFVCWDSLAAAEHEDWDYNDDGTVKVDAYGNPTGNASSAFYFYSSLSGFISGSVEELPLWGNVTWSTWDSQGKYYHYGNHSFGHVRAFKFRGERCIIASTNSWPCGWITIQKAENIVEDDPETEMVNEYVVNYLLDYRNAKGGQNAPPSSAYVFDPASGIGHIIYNANGANVLSFELSASIL